MPDPNDLAARYVALWNEPDDERRRRAIPELFTPDAVHVLDPPQEARDAAAALELAAVFEARGHDALEARVRRAFEMFVAPGEFAFRLRGTARRLRELVHLSWEMVPAGGGEAVAAGLDVLVLADDGRIRADYQLVER
jgi:hypothetical protein